MATSPSTSRRQVLTRHVGLHAEIRHRRFISRALSSRRQARAWVRGRRSATAPRQPISAWSRSASASRAVLRWPAEAVVAHRLLRSLPLLLHYGGARGLVRTACIRPGKTIREQPTKYCPGAIGTVRPRSRLSYRHLSGFTAPAAREDRADGAAEDRENRARRHGRPASGCPPAVRTIGRYRTGHRSSRPRRAG